MELGVVRTLCVLLSDARDVVSLLSTCKDYYSIIKEDWLWRELYHKEFANDFRIFSLWESKLLSYKASSFAVFLESFMDESKPWRDAFASRAHYRKVLNMVIEVFQIRKAIYLAPRAITSAQYEQEISEDLPRAGFRMRDPYLGNQEDLQRYQQLEGILYYAVLKLTYQSMLAWEKEISTTKDIQEKKQKGNPDTVYCVDGSGYGTVNHLHTHMQQCLAKKSAKEINEGDFSLAVFFSFNSANLEWSPPGSKWGFYANYNGELLIWGDLLDFIGSQTSIMQDHKFFEPDPKIQSFE
eukprot:Phypoly_transcript_12864.p1 GENE.Phypoly_transcript_12864~~Phypoly_transcript_12864.p1  ORF type:complete len:307 (+),score=40.62 Phypoly_transcript_12864:36-923(+)